MALGGGVEPFLMPPDPGRLPGESDEPSPGMREAMAAPPAQEGIEDIPFPQMPRQYELSRSVPDHELLLSFRDDEHASAFSDWLSEEGYDIFRMWAQSH